MNRNMNEWVSQIINSDVRKALPIMTYPGLELVQHTVSEVIQDGQAQFEGVAALADRYPSIVALTIMDLSLEAEAFGSPIKFSEQEVPTVTAGIITDMASTEKLRVPVVGEGRTKVYLRAAELSSQKIKDRPTLGGIIGPFSLAGRLFDMTKVMMALVLEPEMVHVVLEKATQFLVQYAQAFKDIGANGIIIAEPAAGLISPAQADEFSSHYIQRIVEAVQDDSFIVILHNCGQTKNHVATMLSTGAVGLHFGNSVDLSEILPQIPKTRLVFGNIDPANVFKNGTPLLMKEKVAELLLKVGHYHNFVLSSGCDIPPGTPLQNVEAFFEALDHFNCHVPNERQVC